MSDGKALVTGWFNQLGAELEFPFEIDENGVCVFSSDGQKVVVEAPPRGKAVFLYARVGSLRPEDGADFYRRLLGASLPNGPLEGASFSVHEPSQAVILGCVKTVRQLDYQGFKNLLGAFAGLARTWSPKIEGLRQTRAEENETRVATRQPNPMAERTLGAKMFA